MHLLCEKPMAMNAQEAEEMLKAAKKNDRKLMIDFSYRFIDHCITLKKIIDKGAIGKIYYCRSVWHRRRGGIPKFGSWFGVKYIHARLRFPPAPTIMLEKSSQQKQA